ncbi:LsrG AI-2 processing enzyme [Pontimonas salivibrio]|uniref:LsrG AI-2 processing enzyme n=1 Tax=Pontimonas salivibrio TaxID=1159327 RepID=A0A2L2BRB0_9MICO|nr:putative quinol monooxygenase [Pontimonas salivibrio]AVG24199.1 LsrG AI-2 processing enzyme [Pontimonas salivibrio]
MGTELSHNEGQKTVIAVATAKSGKEAELFTQLTMVAEGSWDEAGVVKYLVHRDSEVPGRFFMVEVYESEDAFQQHLASDHVRSLLEKLPDLLETDLAVNQGHIVPTSDNAKATF